jgi:hypothetical protein
VAGIPYTPIRSGGAGDEVDFNPASSGTFNYVFLDGGGNATPDHVSFRWESSGALGSAATSYWGGQTSRLVNFFLEFTALAPPFNAPSATRNDVLGKAIQWLLGRPRPTVTLTAPNGGEVLTGNSVNVTWTEAAGPGRAIAGRTLEYSVDGGTSWVPLASGVGPSPYSWDLTPLVNTTSLRVRIKVTDDGAPALTGLDASDANVTLARPGGDTQGPLVVAGSMAASPNPLVRPNPATLTARVTDTNTGASNVVAAEWSIGASPAAAGSGTAMTGAFGTVTVDVSVNLNTAGFDAGAQKLWVRGQDAGGVWGPATALDIQVNGTVDASVVGAPTVAFLSQNAPNPFAGKTAIRFGLPRAGHVQLAVYDLQGRQVRGLIDGERSASVHQIAWDGRDDSGARVGAGVYMYRLITPQGRFDKRMVVLD